MSDVDLLTVPELAALLRTTPGAIYQWRRRGRRDGEAVGPPGALIGGKLLFPRAAVEEWITARLEPAARVLSVGREKDIADTRRRAT